MKENRHSQDTVKDKSVASEICGQERRSVMKMGPGYLKLPGEAKPKLVLPSLLFCFSTFCQTKRGGTRKKKQQDSMKLFSSYL